MVLTLEEIALLVAAKESHTRGYISQGAVTLLACERFDAKVALKKLDRLVALKLLIVQDADHYVLSNAGIKALEGTIGRVDFIRNVIRQKFHI